MFVGRPWVVRDTVSRSVRRGFCTCRYCSFLVAGDNFVPMWVGSLSGSVGLLFLLYIRVYNVAWVARTPLRSAIGFGRQGFGSRDIP